MIFFFSKISEIFEFPKSKIFQIKNKKFLNFFSPLITWTNFLWGHFSFIYTSLSFFKLVLSPQGDNVVSLGKQSIDTRTVKVYGATSGISQEPSASEKMTPWKVNSYYKERKNFFFSFRNIFSFGLENLGFRKSVEFQKNW